MKALSVVSVLLLGVALAGVYVSLPDIVRYLRMRNM